MDLKIVGWTNFDSDYPTRKFTPEEFLTGINIELEHGKINPLTNVTDDNLETVMLDYRMSNIDSDYKNVEMIQQLEDHYIAFIPA